MAYAPACRHPTQAADQPMMFERDAGGSGDSMFNESIVPQKERSKMPLKGQC